MQKNFINNIMSLSKNIMGLLNMLLPDLCMQIICMKTKNLKEHYKCFKFA